MITAISDQPHQQLVSNQPDLKSIVEKLLEESDFKSVAKLMEDLGQIKLRDIESDDPTGYMISKESADKLSSLFKKISKNIDIFFKDLPADEFLPNFYQSMFEAQKRLEKDRLRPELRLELQPLAYSGFDNKFSQKDYESLLFVLALLNYADEKSQGAVLDGDKFVDVHSAIQLKEFAEKLALQRQPEIKDTRFLKKAILALNIAFCATAITSFIKDAYQNSGENQRDRDNSKLTIQISSFFVGAIDMLVNDSIAKKNRPNTNLLLFSTSLYLASQAIVETVADKNIFKTFSSNNKPFFQDDQAFLYALKLGLLLAGSWDERYGIHNVANKMVNIFSALTSGAIKLARDCWHEKAEQTQPDITPPDITPPRPEDMLKIEEFARAFVDLMTEGKVVQINEAPRPIPKNSSAKPFSEQKTKKIEILTS